MYFFSCLQIDDTDAVEDIQSLLTDAPIPAGIHIHTVLLEIIFSIQLCSFTMSVHMSVSLQGSTAVTRRSCLGFTTGLQDYRSGSHTETLQ